QWERPLTPEFDDPAWEAEVRGLFGGFVPNVLKRIASSPWVRRSYLDLMRSPITSLTKPEVELAGLVTSQENPWRLCDGARRVRADEDDGLHRRDGRRDREERAAGGGRAARTRAGAFLPKPGAVEAAPEPEGARADARGRLFRPADRGAGFRRRRDGFRQPGV